jgi:hypothetical protein
MLLFDLKLAPHKRLHATVSDVGISGTAAVGEAAVVNGNGEAILSLKPVSLQLLRFDRERVTETL